MENKKLGEMIRTVRKENGDTLRQLADKIEYDMSNLSKVERGKYRASTELLKRITQVYNLSPLYFGVFFTESESELVLEENLELPDLKKKYHFEVDGVAATDEEIKEAIRLIRFLRSND